ncbi:Uncharacterised protein [Klebsiella pneumoniae subsp. ozaenae]|uniref:Uncharacterized protein n=1 Tax=Klebsiella pneumoniae subsp. ozaenae TaxID=574 RepID=A0A378ADM1_KLEPO|nr:Uncharacterised protein [Klebsiella pneumoniae subsp. ozaenae]
MYLQDIPERRTHPTIVTEYMGECKRNTQPWQSHPTRMLRHKTLIHVRVSHLGLLASSIRTKPSV